MIVVMGLGIFGSKIAEDLTLYNHDVIAVDKDLTSVERIANNVYKSVAMDFTDVEALRTLGVEGADIGIVTCGSQLEEAIMGVLNLKELGVKKIYAKAKNSKYAEVLLKVGADEVVLPEKDTARRYAKKLSIEGIKDIYEASHDYSILEIEMPAKWVGSTLLDLNLRSRFNINIVGVRRGGRMMLNFDPKSKLEADDLILIIGEKDLFRRLDSISK